MTSSAHITHVLDPWIEPQFAEQDQRYEKVFSGDEQLSRDYLRGFRRSSTYAIEWAGDKLLIATKDNYLRLYDPNRGGEEERAWSGEWMAVQTDIKNPFMAAAVSWGGKFRVFDTRDSSKCVIDCDLQKTMSSMKDFLGLAWSPDSTHIALSNRSDHIYIFDLRTAPLRLASSRSMTQEVNQMVWSDASHLWVAAGGTPGKIHVLPAATLQGENAPQLVAHQQTSISLVADPGGKYIASGGGDCLVSLWDPRHMVCTRTFGFATQAVTTLSFNHNASLLAWGTGGLGTVGGERNLTIVGPETGVLYFQDATAAPVQQVRFHPRRNVLAYTLNASQLPEERDRRMGSGRDSAVVHMLKLPDSA